MIEQIRILHIVTKMNNGGLENRLMDIYRNIDRKNVQFDFLTFSTEKGYFDDEILSMGGKIYYFPTIKLRNLYNISKDISNFLNKANYKIVHCHLNQWTGWILKGAKKANVPIRIAHSRTSLRNNSAKNIVKNIVKLNVKKYATHLFAVSNNAARWLFGKKAVKKNLVDIWPNSIEVSKYKFDYKIREQVRNKLNINKDIVIIHVGNIRPPKNHKFLIDIFYEIKKEYNNIKLLIVGKDYLSGKIQRYTKSRGLEKDVIFYGPSREVSDLLQAGDIFVFPSIYEGFPGSVIEAQSSGLPCILSDTITKEVCITPLVKMLSLSSSLDIWKNCIMNSLIIDRTKHYYEIEKSKYNVEIVSKMYCDFYLDVINLRG